jgi:UDP-N-acetyl-D-mannosaminuronic acid dehydrogenase
MKVENVSVVGLGKAGLPLAVVIAEAGHKVIGVDVSQRVADMINRGECPVNGEPGLPAFVKRFHGKRLSATTDAALGSAKTRVHIIIVPLLIDEKYRPDFKYIDAAAKGVGAGLKRGDLVVLETSVPVGTTASRVRKTLEAASRLKAGRDFRLAYSPERIMTGYSISRFKEFPKIVGGIDKRSTDDAYRFYSSFCRNVGKVDNIETAELTKLAEGVYRDVNIAIANELAKVCDVHGVDFWQMRKAANHQYCNILEAGPGVGGHCIPVYPQFVIRGVEAKGKKAPLAKAAREVNDGMAAYYHGKVVASLGRRRRAKVAVVGLAFREGVDETFYTRSKPMIRLLKRSGFEVYGIDPMLPAARIRDEFKVTPHDGADFRGFDCVVLLNKNVEYKGRILKAKVPVVDCKNMLA